MADNNVDKQEENPEVYYYPDNYTNSGRIFNGMIEVRNLVEAVAIAVIMGFFEWVFLLGSSTTKMVAVMVISIGPFFLIALVGINGDSLSQFILALTNFLKNKRKLRYRRIAKNANANTRSKSRPANSKKKTSRT